MAIINRVFTYKIADDYLAQTNDLNKSAQWTYVGPDEFWIFLEQETGKPRDYNCFTKEMNGDVIPTPLGCVKYHVIAGNEPLLATLLGASIELVDGNTLPQFSEVLPNGETYSRPRDPMPDHTYEISDMYYNFDTQQWHFPWKQTWVEWEDLFRIRDVLLTEVNLTLQRVQDFPESVQTILQQYKTDLTNLETTWAGYAAYKVWMPKNPLE